MGIQFAILTHFNPPSMNQIIYILVFLYFSDCDINNLIHRWRIEMSKHVTGLIVSFFLLLFAPIIVTAQIQSRETTGTIIVTYQIDHENLNVDRMRFWLINQEEERTLYPKKDEIIANNHANLDRTVVIAQLPVGHYRIEFLLPNANNIFEEPPSRELELAAGSVIKIDQTIHLKASPTPIETAEVAMSELSLLSPKKSHFKKNLQPFSLPLPSGPLSIKEAQFNLNVNITARWKLMHDGQLIYSGTGSINHLPVPPAQGYYLLAQEITGYSIQMSPSNPFDLISGENFFIDLDYEQEVGFFEIEGNLLEGERKITLNLIPSDQHKPSLKVEIDVTGGKINWQSAPLPVGEYTAIFETHNETQPTEKQKFIINKNRRTILKFPLTPRSAALESAGSLHITSDISQAIYTLFDQSGLIYAQGQGYTHLFENLPVGTYQLNFSSADPRLFIPPSDQTVTVTKEEKVEVEAVYKKMGRLTIGSNIDSFKVTIQPQDKRQKILNELITNKSQNFYLTEGSYRIIYEPLAPNSLTPKSHSVLVRSTAPQTIYGAYSVDSQSTSHSKSNSIKSGIDIRTNLSDASYVLQKIKVGSKNKTVGHYKGKKNSISLEQKGEYTLIFNAVPNFSTPDPVHIKLDTNERVEVIVDYTAVDSFVLIPAGNAITGDPFFDKMANVRPPKEVELSSFEMGVYEVTNIQFAEWLSAALKNKQVFWNSERPGYITNVENLVLCKTTEANPLSQITAQTSSSGMIFTPLPGKENFPVIEVTWYGANAYCKDKNFRLPTENEWEKAAGMSRDLKKRFKYGFGQDQIDRSWANYREVEAPFVAIQVLTTPVGFYDGKQTLPLKTRDRIQVKTQDAKNPFGIYDMSGNVWEWVSSNDEVNVWSNKRIVKGGCYDSLEQGVRVAERLFLAPDHSDIYTGFRVARSPPN